MAKEKQSLDEVKKNKENEAQEKEKQEIAKEIEKILLEKSYAFQTFIQPVVELGVIKALEGRVRLVKVEKNEEKPA